MGTRITATASRSPDERSSSSWLDVGKKPRKGVREEDFSRLSETEKSRGGREKYKHRFSRIYHTVVIIY